MAETLAMVIPAAAGCRGLCGFMAAPADRDFSLSHSTAYHPTVRPSDGAAGLDSPRALAQAEFRPRSEVETDTRWKQLIPYVFIWQGGRCLSYRRPAKNAEARLSGLRSIGFGGHIDPGDCLAALPDEPPRPAGLEVIHAEAVIYAALRREVHEELGLTLADVHMRFRGWVNHDDTPVGSVHLGLVYSCEIKADRGFNPSDEIESAELMSFEEMYGKLDEYELWSQFVLRWLKGQQVSF
jgi:predicted NUDIX family phosphoesterase